MSKRILVESNLATVNPGLAEEWHPTLNDDLTPQGVTAFSKKKVWWQCSKGHEWQAVVGSRSKGVGCPYCAGRLPIVGKTDLATVHPELVEEWHFIKNDNLTPQDVTASSHYMAWWQCSKGHEWQATVGNRSKGRGCPYCAGKKPIVGETDLATVNPGLAAEWHPTKNGTLTPKDVTAFSKKKVWWQCSRGHEWQATVAHRSNGRGCQRCSGRLAVVGETDLATVNPGLVAEWHPTKNVTLSPQDVTAFSNKKVWWQCSRGHEWQAAVSQRSRGTGCPCCSGRLPIVGETDLATVNPGLAAEWHPTKNGTLTTKDVTAFSNKKVWWQCGRGHEWQAAVTHRSRGRGCRRCSGRLAVVGETDLATVNPGLAEEWHPTLNDDLTPQGVTAFSKKKVWWQCSKGHEWQATVSSRSSGKGCPYCAGKLPIVGETDLATVHPELVEEWHPIKNDNLTPQDVTASSHFMAWWQCSKGHEWQATVGCRSRGTGCPCCSGRLPIVGETDLATVRPELAAEWHPTKNVTLSPQDVTASSDKKAWWRCGKGHEWRAIVGSRSRGAGCPRCRERTNYKMR